MSLINKMLQDLEARHSAAKVGTPSKPVYADLRPAQPLSFSTSFPNRLRRVVLMVVVAAAGGIYAWYQWGASDTGAKKVPVPTATTAKPAELGLASPAVEVEPAPVVVAPPVAEVKPPKAEPAAAPKKPATATAAKTADESVAVEKKMKPLSAEDEAEGHYRQAVNALQQGRSGEAEAHARAALQHHPAHTRAREILLAIALQNGRTREARELLEQGMQKNPKYYPFAQLAARLYVDQGQEGKALALLEGAQAAGVNDPEFMGLLATVYQRAGRHAEAIKAFGQAARLSESEGRWWLGLGISYEAEQQWAPAREAYTRARLSGTLDARLIQYIEQRLAAIRK